MLAQCALVDFLVLQLLQCGRERRGPFRHKKRSIVEEHRNGRWIGDKSLEPFHFHIED